MAGATPPLGQEKTDWVETTASKQIMNREILKLAFPAIATNISVPLIGLTDTFIAGHLSALHLGAVGTGSALISMLYWNFGFIRMSTSGMAAQAYGGNDKREMANTLCRSALFSLIGILFILLIKAPFCQFVFDTMKTPGEIRELAETYFNICIWGAAPTLFLYSIKGWFIGMQNTLFPMFISILMNITNIILSCTFVFHFGMGINGMAYGTMLSQYLALLVALLLLLHRYKGVLSYANLTESIRATEVVRLAKINGAIFLRSLCLVAVTTFLPFAGAKEGALILAGNTLLMQFFTFFSYFLDGFAYAGEALAGRFVGARDRERLNASVRLLFLWGVGIAFLFTIAYACGTERILLLLTNQTDVTTAIAPYIKWVIAIPAVSFAAFLWDGIMVGATKVHPMLYGTGCAAIVFFGIYIHFGSHWHNNAIWMAFVCYLATRSIVQTFWWRSHPVITNKTNGTV